MDNNKFHKTLLIDLYGAPKSGTKKVLRMKRIKWCLLILLALVIGTVAYETNGYYQNRRLFRAIKSNDFMMAQSAIQYGAFVNVPEHVIYFPPLIQKNYTPLIEACTRGNEMMVNLLLAHGADVNLADNRTGHTPLLAALAGLKPNRFSLALLLIDHGANMHAVREGVDSPFQRSLLRSDLDSEETKAESIQLLSVLLANNVEQRIYVIPENALTDASRSGNDDAILYLLEHDAADINVQNRFGQTALMTAVIHHQADTVALLLQLGANKSMTDDRGKSAFDDAAEQSDDTILALLNGHQP